MNTEGLRYAVAVSETRSFSAAARAYGVTQPALSNGIARLEETLGDRLFDRSPRGVTPTTFGLRMLPLIEHAVSSMDAITSEARRATERTAPCIRVGMSPLIDTRFASAAYAAVKSLESPRDLVLREANLDDLRTDLAAGNLDVILVPVVAPMARFKHVTFAEEPLVVVGTGGACTPVDIRAIGDRSLILLPDTCGLTRLTENLLETAEQPIRRYPGEATSYHVLEDWARLGLGAAVVPLSKVVDREAGFGPVRNNGQDITIRYEAVWSGQSEHDEALEVVAEQLTLAA